MKNQPNSNSSPRRVIAGKLNRSKWKGLTREGRQRLRQAALTHKPWTRSTGPRTASGKKRSAENGRWRQMGTRSIRQVRSDLNQADVLLETLQQLQHVAAKARANEIGESEP